MVMGTSSSAGKSLLTAALCRCFARRGIRVAPFKAQNMSNNAAVCADRGEIGRSQALQAQAAGVLPHTDMNPVLLKPEGDTRSQVIVNGRPLQTFEAADHFERRAQLWPHVTAALDRLRENHELVMIEGAGSPAELNLADVEMVNMSIARYCRAPVLLVGDIERGGVFAQLLGTLWLLPPEDRQLICGLIVNKFRGDLRLFDRGVELLQKRGHVPVLGVLPWVSSLNLPEEDAADLGQSIPADSSIDKACLDIAVIRFPHIANFDDFDPLRGEASVRLRYVQKEEEIGRPDVVILPGTKNTIGDLRWLRETGLATELQQQASRNVTIIGICGGYQMLGKQIRNPNRLENCCECIEGLGLLDIETVFEPEKLTSQVQMVITNDLIAPSLQGEILRGYEIHIGRTKTSTPWLSRTSGGKSSAVAQESNDLDRAYTDGGAYTDDCAHAADGAHANGGRIWGCYLHGLFHNDKFRNAWLVTFGVSSSSPRLSAVEATEQSLNRIADAVEQHVDVDRIWLMINQFENESQHVR